MGFAIAMIGVLGILYTLYMRDGRGYYFAAACFGVVGLLDFMEMNYVMGLLMLVGATVLAATAPPVGGGRARNNEGDTP